MIACPTCTNHSNPENFGGSCDHCEAKRQARTERTRNILRAVGQQSTDLGRALGA